MNYNTVYVGMDVHKESWPRKFIVGKHRTELSYDFVT